MAKSIGMVIFHFWMPLIFSGALALADDTEPVRIAGSAWIGDAPTKLADQLGYFNLELTVNEPVIEVVEYGSGLEALRSLVQGHSRFALAATTPVVSTLLEQTNGRVMDLPDIVVLASMALSNRTHKLIVREGLDTRMPTEWDNQRVGVMFGTSSHFGWFHFATFHGLEEENYTLVDIPVDHMAQALLNEEIDAVVVWSPWERKLKDRIGEDLFEFPLRMLYTVNWLLLVDRKFAIENPEVVDRVLLGYLEAMEFIDAEPERAHRLHADQAGLPIDVLLEKADGMIWRVGVNWSVLVNMGMQLEWLNAQPGYERRARLDPRQYLYGKPLKRLDRERVTLPDYLLLRSLEPESRP